MNYTIEHHLSDDQLATAAARGWVADANEKLRQDRPLALALSGGRIAKKFCAQLASALRQAKAPLGSLHFFWGDERCVPPDDPESNFRLAKEHLLDPLQIAPGNIHRIQGEITPEDAAREAAAELARIKPATGENPPSIDWIILGMGEDGHVASLFPGGPGPEEEQGVYYPVEASKPPPKRITLSYAAIAAAQEVWVLASGAGKETALAASLDPKGQTPLAKVLRSRGRSRIWTDIGEQPDAD